MTWQPIETAPKDGTRVIVGHPEMTSTVSRWGGWSELRADGSLDNRHLGWTNTAAMGLGLLKPQPTHWQPLPAPPQPREPSE